MFDYIIHHPAAGFFARFFYLSNSSVVYMSKPFMRMIFQKRKSATLRCAYISVILGTCGVEVFVLICAHDSVSAE